MPQADQPTSPTPTATTTDARKSKAPAAPPAEPTVFAFSMDPKDGSILTFERLDDSGARHKLSPEEKAKLAKAYAGPTLTRVVEEAFEAGIECVLGEGEEEETGEANADGDLTRELLRSLIDRSKAKRLIEDRTLDRAAVATLIVHAVAH